MSSLTLLLAVTAALLGLGGCNQKQTSDNDLVEIDYKRLVSLMEDTRRPSVLLDVRTRPRYDEGHIPGAINIPLPDIARHDPRLGQAHSIIVYGTGWLDLLPPAGAKKMLALGYQNIYLFRGGIDQWQAQGRAITRLNAPAAAPGKDDAGGKPDDASAKSGADDPGDASP